MSARLMVGPLALMMIALGCVSSGRGDDEVLVFAAASMRDVLTELGEEYEAQSGNQISFSFAGSQTLAQQIAAGAPADMFISAGVFPVDFLRNEGMTGSEPVNLVTNKLIVAALPDGVKADTVHGLTEIQGIRITIADPNLAPAGRYARESLTSLGLWETVQGDIILGSDVRATLAYLETGNADVAFVYQTDVFTIDKLTILDIVPAESYSPIVYPALLVKGADQLESARRFLDFLHGDTSAQVFRNHGFDPL